MNPRLATCLIWLTLVMVWPVSMFGLDGSFTPVARFIQLASALSWLGFLEGTEGMVGLFIGLLWGHAVVYGAARGEVGGGAPSGLGGVATARAQASHSASRSMGRAAVSARIKPSAVDFVSSSSSRS